MTTTLDLLKAAVQAKLDYWDASRALEKSLGFDDVPDAVDQTTQERLNVLAVDGAGQEQADLDNLLAAIRGVS